MIFGWLHFEDEWNRKQNLKPRQELRFKLNEKPKNTGEVRIHPILLKHFKIPHEEKSRSAKDEEIIKKVKEQLNLKNYNIDMEAQDDIPKIQIERNDNDEPT